MKCLTPSGFKVYSRTSMTPLLLLLAAAAAPEYASAAASAALQAAPGPHPASAVPLMRAAAAKCDRRRGMAVAAGACCGVQGAGGKTCGVCTVRWEGGINGVQRM